MTLLLNIKFIIIKSTPNFEYIAFFSMHFSILRKTHILKNKKVRENDNS